MLFKTCKSQDSKEYKISEIIYPMLVLELILYMLQFKTAAVTIP